MIGIVVIDGSGLIISASAAFIAMTGYPRDQVEQRMNVWHRIGPPEWRDAPDHALASIARERGNPVTERELIKSDDTAVSVLIELAGTEVRDDGARHTLAVVDYTQVKTLEQANLELEQANKELTQFAYVASHDLQEPLRTMRSYVELLAEEYGDSFNERGRKWLNYVAGSAQRMHDLIDDLLSYSQAGQDKRITAVDTARLIRAITEDLDSHITSIGAEIVVGSLPTIRVNETELRQVFQNLISNALKFRRTDVSMIVSISAEPAFRGWEFKVQDNGIGIDHTHHSHIFHMFQRLNNRKDYAGTGIGLALVKKIVTAWSGEVFVQSTPGQGSTFHFTVPSEFG